MQQGILPEIQQPWGFDGVKRQSRAVYSDSRNFYVQPDHPEATDANSGEDPEHPLSTIARAVVLARAYMGDVIYVMGSDAWQYGAGTQAGIIESVTIPADKPGLSLIGVGAGSMGVYWQPASDGGTCLTILAMDTHVVNFCFWGGAFGSGQRGIFCDWGAPTKYGENTVIQSCTFTEDCDYGIQLEYAYYVKILDCMFQESGNYGIYVDPAGQGIRYCQIINNLFLNCDAAMGLRGADDCLVEGNKIFNSRAQSGAAATNEGIDTTGGLHNLVMANFFSCLLPVPANGDYDDLNTAAATDAWVGNLCMNGAATTNPT
jgi:hypothetical protein